MASLIVNDGKVNSTTATVTVTAAVANVAPVANAGIAQNVTTGTVVTLDGSASSDANGDLITYSWTLTSKPAGSAATLASATSARPTFTAELAGTYVASLTVNDGKVNSTTAAVTVTAAVANVAPVANAGVAQNVVAGTLVTLDGSASSDANGDLITYSWTLTSKPAGSAATLASATSARATFTAELAGIYVASLTVNDGKVNGVPAIVVVTTSPQAGWTYSVQVTPTQMNFGSVTIGTQSAEQVATITNTGTGPLTLSTQMVGVDYIRSSTTCGASIPAGSSCSMGFKFAPTLSGPTVAELVAFRFAELASQSFINFSGSGVSANGWTYSVQVTPTQMNFGSVTIGTQSAEQVATITNTGTGPLTLSTQMVGVDYIRSSTTCGASIPAGSSCSMGFKFAPTLSGPTVAELVAFRFAELASQSFINFSGTGTR